jgi:hypothetical protein
MSVSTIVVPAADATALLPGWSFADGYGLYVTPSVEAPEAARRAFLQSPAWVTGLLRLRNAVVKPFGLKTDLDRSQQTIGTMAVISSAADEVILGMDDRHLDFRVAIRTAPLGHEGTTVSVVSVVRTNNALGRAYLAAVMPFHRVIVPALLRRVASAAPASSQRTLSSSA